MTTSGVPRTRKAEGEGKGISCLIQRRAEKERERTSLGVKLGLVELSEELGEGVEGSVHCWEGERESGQDGAEGTSWVVDRGIL